MSYPKSTHASKKTVRIDVLLRSRHPKIPALVLLTKLNDASPTLQRRLVRKYGATHTRIERRKTLPIAPNDIVVTIFVSLGTAIAQTAAKKITEDVYSWIKKQLRYARIRKLSRLRSRKK